MRRARRYEKVEIRWFLVGLEDQVAVGANGYPQVKENKVVGVAVTGPVQAPPLIEAMEGCVQCKDAVRLWEQDCSAIINESFEKWEVGLRAGNQAFYFKEANIEVSVVNWGDSAHVTALSMLPKGVSELKDVATNDLCQGFDEEVHRHALR
jgi:hypothetical protein